MPWSDWQDPVQKTEGRGPTKTAATSSDGYVTSDTPGSPPDDLGEARSAALTGTGDYFDTEVTAPLSEQTYTWSQAFTEHDQADPTKASSQAHAAWRMWFYGLRPNQELRDTFPDPLDNLEEGVDFTTRPDRDGSEPDAFIEYEDGLLYLQPSDIQAWDGNGTLTVTGDRESVDPVDDLTASLSVTSEPFVPAGLYYSPDGFHGWLPGEDVGGHAAVAYIPPGGSPFLRLDYVPTGTTETGSFHIGPGKAFFTVVADGDWNFPTSGADVSGLYTMTVNPSLSVAWTIRPPRWRYWIPGVKPLRQRQRDDGLGSSTRRARGGTSRQRSIRQRGYL